MKQSIYSKIGVILKKVTGIKDFSLFRKEVHKRIGKIIYHKKYTAHDLVALMQEMGMKKGSVVCIHSSMKEFYNYQGTAEELIKAILEVIDIEEGTLIMPAFPIYELMYDPTYIFDKEKDKTGAGYLAETFRKMPGVYRSINVQHSVCALGKHAKWLTKNHHECHDCWDVDSPWQRMLTLDALVFNMGLPRSYMGTFHHCVESVLQYEHPYWKQFINQEMVFRYYDDNHKVKTYTCFKDNIDRRTRKKQVTKYFDSNDWCIRRISNLEVKVFYTKYCFPKMLSLGRHGISVYYIPSTKNFEFPDYENA